MANPFLDINTYIADGEPHVFGDRVYLFGSHDIAGGNTYCMLDYTFPSAPLDDLENWTSRGISYRAEQDPQYGDILKYMYAPDVVQGNDGRFYLYYCMSGEKGVGGYGQKSVWQFAIHLMGNMSIMVLFVILIRLQCLSM